MSKKHIFENLQNRSFSKLIKESLLPFLEEHQSRIIFVKSVGNFVDLLYFEESNAVDESYPISLVLNNSSDDQSGSEFLGLDKVITVSVDGEKGNSIEELKNELTHFFEQTTRYLYVEVGFIENFLTNDDLWEYLFVMEDNKEMEPYEVLLESRVYPDWYTAASENDLKRMNDSIYLTKCLERILIKNEIEKLQNKIDDSLLKNKIDEVSSFNKRYKQLKSQMKEIKQQNFL